MEEKKISVISIIVEDKNVSVSVNELLHEFSEYIIGRMGIPYRDRDISIICIASISCLSIASINECMRHINV